MFSPWGAGYRPTADTPTARHYPSMTDTRRFLFEILHIISHHFTQNISSFLHLKK